MTVETNSQPELDELADDMIRRGFAEGGDFFISGHRPVVEVSSEYVGLIADGERLRVFYADMDNERTLIETTEFSQARARFVSTLLDLGRGRGRRIDSGGLTT